ncbi:hypothetical protein R3X25_12290 [Lutibacter sp. TH_r2]|uniref:hypothetical protein n=1 Tax=Lutibacter sp. TH_r2 TaxID=3082083 RepID=UPI002953BC9B|nr:hypothetical protein [Lutibacter sp. TH_r2]MDV7188064.1 hypothetical protein [Lutibacter sp. TH_r2]
MDIFTNQSFTHLLELFFWLLGAFIIGFVFGRISTPKKETPQIYFDNPDDIEDLEQDTSQIRATKTFERGGKQMVQSYFEEEVVFEHVQKGLNFDNIGKGSEKNKDNLQLIKGVGALIEEKLNKIGIYNFKQISKLTSTDIDKITELIKFFPGRIERDNWVEQAKKLLK